MTPWVDLLDKTLKYIGGSHDVKDVLDEVESGQVNLWTDDDAVIVTEIYRYPNEKLLHYWLAGGELESVIRLGKKVEAWGRQQGCTRATINGRKGWEKPLAKEGFHPKLVTFSKDL